MKVTRRSFLKGAGAVGAVAATTATVGLKTAEAGAGHMEGHYKGPHEMPRGMTLLNMRQGNVFTLGVKTSHGILDVRKAAHLYHLQAPMTTDELLQGGNARGLERLVKAALAHPRPGVFLDEATIQYGPALTNPEKIVCVGLNYKRHALEVHLPIPKQPVLFNKYNNTLNHHKGTIKLPTNVSTKFDYEVELVIVIGKYCDRVSEADALNYVAGYCTGNDFSSRDLQFDTGGQWMAGKTSDGYAPLGPYLVTADLVGNPNNLALECRVNGQTRQSSNTNDFIFNCQQMISYTSQIFPLKPGDIIFTGTPQGVIAGYPKDKQVWLKPGDEVACSIEKLGELRFRLT